MCENYSVKSVISQYLEWHFYDVPKNIIKAWGNYIAFNIKYFSIPLLLKTFFHKWRKYQYYYGRSFDLGKYFEVFTFNLISRMLGAVMRIFLILVGLLLEIVIICLGAVILVGWLLLPLILAGGLYFGLRLII